MIFTDKTTIGNKYGPAMEIVDQAEAERYFARCVEHCMTFGKKARAEAELIERGNLGYYAGYYDRATRERVERLFNCTHPVFGKASEGVPTADEAVIAGMRMAQRYSETHFEALVTP